MITPKWVLTKCQPIAIRDVIQYLIGVMLNEKCYNDSFDIGGPDIITYKQMMLSYAETRKIKLWILHPTCYDSKIIFLLVVFCNLNFL